MADQNSRMGILHSLGSLIVNQRNRKDDENLQDFVEQKASLVKSLLADDNQIKDLIVSTSEGLLAAEALRTEGLWDEKHIYYPDNGTNYPLLKRLKKNLKALKHVDLKSLRIQPAESSESLAVKRVLESSVEAQGKCLSLIEFNKTLLKRFAESSRAQDDLLDEIGLREAELEKLTKKFDEVVLLHASLCGLFERLRSCVNMSGGVVDFADALRSLAQSISSSASDGEDDVTVEFRACIRVLAEKVGILSSQHAELLDRYSKAEAANKQLSKELEERKELLRSTFISSATGDIYSSRTRRVAGFETTYILLSFSTMLFKSIGRHKDYLFSLLILKIGSSRRWETIYLRLKQKQFWNLRLKISFAHGTRCLTFVDVA